MSAWIESVAVFAAVGSLAFVLAWNGVRGVSWTVRTVARRWRGRCLRQRLRSATGRAGEGA